MTSYQTSTDAPGICLTYLTDSTTKVYFYDLTMAMIGPVALSSGCEEGSDHCYDGIEKKE